MEKQTKPSTSKEGKTGKIKNAVKPLQDDKIIHTINPFTGEKTDISNEDLENMEKWNEAQTERD